MNETETIATVVGIISAVVGAVCTKGVDALLRLRHSRLDEHAQLHRSNLEERKYEDDRTIEGYRATITELQSRVTHLETILDLQEKRYEQQLEALRKEHIECVKL